MAFPGESLKRRSSATTRRRRGIAPDRDGVCSGATHEKLRLRDSARAGDVIGPGYVDVLQQAVGIRYAGFGSKCRRWSVRGMEEEFDAKTCRLSLARGTL